MLEEGTKDRDKSKKGQYLHKDLVNHEIESLEIKLKF